MSDTQQSPSEQKAADVSAPVAVPVKKKGGPIGSMAADIIGGISSVVVGGMTAIGLIKERAYKNLSSMHMFEDLKEARQIEGEDLTSRLKPLDFTSGVKDPELIEKLNAVHFTKVDKATREARKLAKDYLKTEDAQKEFEDLVVKYGKLADERMQEAGAGSLLKKWGKLRGHQKWEVGLTSAAYGGIALGSILLATRSLFSSKEESQKDSGSQR